MAKGKLQLNLEYLLARLILGFLGLLPRPWAICLGRGMGRIAYRLPLKLRRTGERNLEIAFPAMSRQEKQRLLRGCFDSLGRQLAEFSQFPRTSRAPAPDYRLRSSRSGPSPRSRTKWAWSYFSDRTSGGLGSAELWLVGAGISAQLF